MLFLTLISPTGIAPHDPTDIGDGLIDGTNGTEFGRCGPDSPSPTEVVKDHTEGLTFTLPRGGVMSLGFDNHISAQVSDFALDLPTVECTGNPLTKSTPRPNFPVVAAYRSTDGVITRDSNGLISSFIRHF